MSPEVVAARCGPDLSCVKYLNLHSNHIRKIENLGQLVRLETLILSFNEIAKIENVEVLTALQVRSRVEISQYEQDEEMATNFRSTTLQTLDLSFNMVRRFENMKTLSTLTDLAMNSNLLHRTEDLSMLRKYVPHLVTLNLANNPVCEMKSYRHYVLRRLLKLEHLDGRQVLSLSPFLISTAGRHARARALTSRWPAGVRGRAADSHV